MESTEINNNNYNPPPEHSQPQMLQPVISNGEKKTKMVDFRTRKKLSMVFCVISVIIFSALIIISVFYSAYYYLAFVVTLAINVRCFLIISPLFDKPEFPNRSCFYITLAYFILIFILYVTLLIILLVASSGIYDSLDVNKAALAMLIFGIIITVTQLVWVYFYYALPESVEVEIIPVRDVSQIVIQTPLYQNGIPLINKQELNLNQTIYYITPNFKIYEVKVNSAPKKLTENANKYSVSFTLKVGDSVSFFFRKLMPN